MKSKLIEAEEQVIIIEEMRTGDHHKGDINPHNRWEKRTHRGWEKIINIERRGKKGTHRNILKIIHIEWKKKSYRREAINIKNGHS